MNVLMSLHNVWCDKILDGSKTLEFRNNIGKNFKIGDTVYLYETSKNKGRKLVVGQFKIKDIKKIQNTKIKSYSILPYYAKNIVKDKEIKNAILNIFDSDIVGNEEIKISLMFCPEYLNDFKRTNKLPDVNILTKEESKKYFENLNKAKMVLKNCDEWLLSIGYYNGNYETNYKNYIEISEPIRYEKPLKLENFKNLNDEKIKRAPQSWFYVK